MPACGWGCRWGLLAACCCPACPYAWAVLLAALLGLLGALVPARLCPPSQRIPSRLLVAVLSASEKKARRPAGLAPWGRGN